MQFEDSKQQEKYGLWLNNYLERSDEVTTQLGQFFHTALSLMEKTDDNALDFSKCLDYIKTHRDEFPYRLIYVLYSSRFDKEFEKDIIDTPEKREAFMEEYWSNSETGLTPEELMQRKVELLDEAFQRLSLTADVLAGHYTVMLSDHPELQKYPLVWDLPLEDEAVTGYSPDLFWQMNFRFLCEISQAIIAYGGYTKSFFDEIVYIRNRPDLDERTLWLDQDMRLYFPDNMEKTWGLDQIAEVLESLK